MSNEHTVQYCYDRGCDHRAYGWSSKGLSFPGTPEQRAAYQAGYDGIPMAEIPGVRGTWTAAKAAYAAGNRDWQRSDDRTFEEMLGCVPPAWHGHDAFACGEPWDHAGDGQPIYLCMRRRFGGRCEARLATLAEFKAE